MASTTFDLIEEFQSENIISITHALFTELGLLLTNTTQSMIFFLNWN